MNFTIIVYMRRVSYIRTLHVRMYAMKHADLYSTVNLYVYLLFQPWACDRKPRLTDKLGYTRGWL